MRSLLRLLPVLLALATPAAAQTPAQTQTQAQWLTLPRGVEYPVPATGAATTLRIPVRLSDTVQWPQVTLTVTDVHREGRSEEWMMAPFATLPRSATAAGGGPALLIPVKPDAFREAGTYTVEIEARAPGQALQRLQLRLVRPAAQLGASPLQLRHEVPFGGGRRAWADSLLVNETTGAASIIQLTPRPPLFAVPGGATLRFRSAPVGVAAGSTARIPFRVDGGLPLGTTAGTLRLASPQLAAPLDVPVTIVTHRPGWTLIGAILLGLLLGWLVRNYLTHRIELNRLRLQADDVLVRMDEHMSAHADAGFHAEVRALADPLRQARDGDSSEALAAAVTAADAGLRTALEALATRLTVARDRGVALGRLARTEWNLPPRLRTALAGAREALDAADAALSRRDAAGATRRLDEAEARLRSAFGEALDTWPIERKGVLDGLAALPPGVGEHAEGWIAAIRTDVDAVVPPEGDDLESLRPALTAVHRARIRETRLAAALPDRVDALGARVRDALVAGTPDHEALKAFQAALDAFRRAATAPGQDPDETLRMLAIRELPAVEQAFRSVIGAHTSAAARTEVAAFLAEQQYVSAATRAAQADTRDETLLGEGDEEGPRAPAPAAQAAAEQVPGIAAPGAPRTGGVPLPAIGVPERVRVHRVRVWRELMLDQLLLTVIVGAAITLVGYFLYSADFVGTGRELLTIFLWAFGLDVGVETLLAQSARLAAPNLGAVAGAVTGATAGAVVKPAARAGTGAGVDENNGADAGTGAGVGGATGAGAGTGAGAAGNTGAGAGTGAGASAGTGAGATGDGAGAGTGAGVAGNSGAEAGTGAGAGGNAGADGGTGAGAGGGTGAGGNTGAGTVAGAEGASG